MTTERAGEGGRKASLGARIAAQARTYLGTPWFHTGRSRNGIDCIGLLACVAHDLEITDYDERNYALEESGARLTQILLHYCQPVNLRPDAYHPFVMMEEGDLVQFLIMGEPRHCGIYALAEKGGGFIPGQPTLIHAYQSAGSVLEHPFDGHWQRRLYATYRVREGG